MYNHSPEGYSCPLCAIAHDWPKGAATESVPNDIVYRDGLVTAFVSAHWWPRNPGHVVVIPNEHFENIYDLPVTLAGEIHRTAREVAIAFKAVYKCDGVSTRQHNEPAGNQDVWHYHLHVFPRYEGDQLYGSQKRVTAPEERAPYSARLRAFFADRARPR